MKRIISFISIFILLINLFAFPIPVKADGLPVPGYSELKEMQQDIEAGDNRTVQDIWHVLQPIGQAVGVIMNPIQTIEFIRDIVDPVAQTLPDYPTNGTEQEKTNFVSDYIINNVTIDDNSKNYTLNDNSKNLLNGVISNYIDNTGFYYNYSTDLLLDINSFGNAEYYAALRRVVSDYQDQYYIFYFPGSEATLTMFKKTNNIVQLLVSHYNTYYDMGTVYNADLWTADTTPDKGFIWRNNTFNEFTPSTRERSGLSFRIDKYVYPAVNSDPNFILISNNRTTIIKVYKTLNDLKGSSIGVQPYYYNNTVYNNYKNSSNTYTVTNDNSNHATYGDVNSYIDNSVTENEVPPSDDEINIYIEQVPAPTPTPTPTPTPGPGNDNGGSGTVSGNTNNGGTASASATANNSGVNVTVNNNHNINFTIPTLSGNGSGTVSGNGNGSGGIFDWISDIGGVIGEFIKNVGSLIADVIKGITETITTILADIPNIISVLIEFVYGGLPDELKAIVTLGITTVIFVGVIKMMRK